MIKIMKKEYFKPEMSVLPCEQDLLIGSRVHTDDPQSPGGALSRQGRFTTSDYDWSEEDE